MGMVGTDLMCARGRTACRSAAVSTLRCRHSRADPRTRVQFRRRHPVQQPAASRRNYEYRDAAAGTRTPTTMATAPPTTTSSIRSRFTASIPNFHFVGMTFNPEGFADMKDKYFLLNGRSYPGHGDTRAPGRRSRRTASMHFSQPLPAIINIPVGGKALAAHLGSGRHRVPDAGLARHPDEG